MAALVAGSLFIPNFKIGVAAGFVSFVAKNLIRQIKQPFKFIKEEKIDKNELKSYLKSVYEKPYNTIFFNPIFEELLFRALIQPLISTTIIGLAPSTNAALYADKFSIASVVSLFISSYYFGTAHYSNYKSNSQALSATISGLVMGALAIQFGIQASIAAHITNNALVLARFDIFIYLQI